MIDKISLNELTQSSTRAKKLNRLKNKPVSYASGDSEVLLESAIEKLIDESGCQNQLIRSVVAKLVEELLGSNSVYTEFDKSQLVELASNKIQSDQNLLELFSRAMK